MTEESTEISGTWKPEFNPGFRISLRDTTFILAALIASAFLYAPYREIALLILTVTFHFFLFCNVFRISRLPELVWAGCFVALWSLNFSGYIKSLPVVISSAIVVAGILIFLETRKLSYHGIFWKTVNPGLEKWFKNEKT